ncbi:MAG TPA: sigma-54 dependent transcriptional regulator [Candidatus Binatia bacterium]|nr:sigma-54 dependent transcriptional regulator [Candidatus Binatia bacterium]
MTRILVIAKDAAIAHSLAARLSNQVVTEAVSSPVEAKQRFHWQHFDLIIYDADARPSHRARTLQLLAKWARKYPAIRVIVIGDSQPLPPSGLGVRKFEWIEPPLDEAHLLASVSGGLAGMSQAETLKNAASALLPPTDFEGILAISLPMRLVFQQVNETAAVEGPVLITGETGTGKDMVAAAIHKHSRRQHRPYVPVNMGAISHELVASELFGHEKGAFTGAVDAHLGVFEQAQGGSIFLDEITSMDEKTQVSLLRILETKTMRRVGGIKDIDVNARVIAATNENIEETVKARRFREDLYYRLDVFRIHLPPLRQRPGDVTFLTNHFIAHFGAMYHKSIRRAPAEIYQILRAYPWPGNVRELKNVIQRAVVMAKGAELIPELLPSRVRDASDSGSTQAQPPIHVGMSLEDVEREFITMTLDSVVGNKAKAAATLKISRHTLYDKLKRYGLL